MKTRTPKLNSLVEVIWIDAFCREGWHEGPKNPRKWVATPYIVKSVGYYKGKDKTYISICQGRHEHDEQLDNSLFIPHGMIRKVRKLK